MANTYELIASTTVGSGGASSITFMSTGNIPNTYTDLKLVWSLRSNSGTYPALWIYINSDTTSGNYGNIWLRGYGTGVDTGSGASGVNYYLGDSDGSSLTSNTFSNGELYLPNYTVSYNKTWSVDHVSETNASGARANLMVGLWSNTNAITSISLQYETGGGSFVQYSTAYLYGIKSS